MGPKKHPLQTARDQRLDREAHVCRCGSCRRCRNRASHARYEKTEKGKAALRRYRQTAKGNDVAAKSNAHRIYIGQRYAGRAATIQQAALIQQHVKERLSAFKQRQSSRAEMEALAAEPISL